MHLLWLRRGRERRVSSTWIRVDYGDALAARGQLEDGRDLSSINKGKRDRLIKQDKCSGGKRYDGRELRPDEECEEFAGTL